VLTQAVDTQAQIFQPGLRASILPADGWTQGSSVATIPTDNIGTLCRQTRGTQLSPARTQRMLGLRQDILQRCGQGDSILLGPTGMWIRGCDTAARGVDQRAIGREHQGTAGMAALIKGQE